MTLWDRRLGLILGLAFFIFACEEPGEIGLELNPENGVFVAKYDEIPVKTAIILYEDILSDNSTRIDQLTQGPTSGGRLLTGNYSTVDFGEFESKAFTSVYLSSAGFKPHDDYIFDSLVLSVKVDYLYGNNFAGNKRIFVHELAEEIKIDSLYLTKNFTPYIEQPIGEFNIDISAYDTTTVDTVYTTRLSDELGMRFLEKAKADTLVFNNNEDFREFFDGIAFVSEEGNNVTTGIVAESQTTYMRLHIHDDEDTTYFNFILQGWNKEGINITRYYNNITLDRTGTPIEAIPEYHVEFQADNNLSYVQASAGILTKLNLGPYLNFLDTVENLIINRAELVIPVENYNDYFEPPAALDLYVTDESNKFVEIYDSTRLSISYATVGRPVFAQENLENKGQYISNITSYIQSLASGTSTDTLLLIGQAGLWSSVTIANQFTTNSDNIKLKVYYSTLQ